MLCVNKIQISADADLQKSTRPGREFTAQTLLVDMHQNYPKLWRQALIFCLNKDNYTLHRLSY